MIVLGIVVKATALLALAFLVDARLRRRGSAAARHLVWAFVMAGLLTLPIAESALPHWTVPIPVPARTATASVVAATVYAGAPSAFVGEPLPRPEINWLMLIGAGYVIGLLILIVRLLVEPIALGRLARASRELKDDRWLRILDETMAQLRIARRVRLLQSADEIVPITFGTLRPAVLVPSSTDAWSADRRRAVLLHELAHVARFDCLTQLVGAVACAIYWPHPAVWLAARRMRIERELACDDRVLAAGAEPRAYAGHLLELAHSLRAAPALATALAMARARDLEIRLLSIVDAARNRAGLPRNRSAIALATAMAVLLPMATLRAEITAAARATLQAAQDPGDAWAQEAGARLLDELSRNGYAKPDSDLLVRAAQHGVDAQYVSGMAAVGYRVRTLNALMQLREHGIDPEYVSGMAANGFASMSVDDLLRARAHGIDPDYISGMRTLGYRSDMDGLLQLRSHGIDPDYISGLAALGYRTLPVETLLRMRSHGVDPEYIQRVQAKRIGQLTPEQLIDRRDRGLDEPGAAAREMYAALQSLWRSLVGR